MTSYHVVSYDITLCYITMLHSTIVYYGVRLALCGSGLEVDFAGDLL